MLHTIFRAVAVAGLITSVSAHAVMSMPQAYGFGNGLTNGPMTEADFPCKKNEVQFTGGNTTTWSGGQAQPLKLLSGATHGGGSCFIAMTYETPGSAAFEDASNWKNVYTIPGDCPANTPGNLENNMHFIDSYPTGPQCSSENSGQTNCVHSYTIDMPDELKDGDATFGWVWLSHVTMETYMNCAPITISGSKNNGQYDSLPSLEGMSFTGLSGGGVPGASDSSSSSSDSESGSAPASASGTDTTTSSPTTTSTATAITSTVTTSTVVMSTATTSTVITSGTMTTTAITSTVITSTAATSTVITTTAAATTTAATTSSSTSPASSASVLPSVVVATGSGDSGADSAAASADYSLSGACTSGAIQCSGSTWAMCSNEAWVSMGSVGGLTCTDGTLNKMKRFRGMR